MKSVAMDLFSQFFDGGGRKGKKKESFRITQKTLFE